MNKDLFTLGDAIRQMAPRVFATLAKPVGSRCNLSCRYCYYLGTARQYGNRPPVMPPELLERYIRQTIEANQTDTVDFCWHGGEPLLAGIAYYEHALQLQRRYAAGRRIGNQIQTNGLLVDEVWCRFFADNGFLVGLSVDGPATLHDAHRVDRGGRATLDRVLAAADLFRRMHVDYNTLTVVSARSEGRGAEVYRFLRDTVGSRFMQFLPAVDWLPDGSPAPWSVSAEGYGAFLCEVFDEWVRRDVGTCYVQLFDTTLAQWCGLPAGVCVMGEACDGGLTVEHNGDVYPCDHFVAPAYRLGNIADATLADLYDGAPRLRFALAKRNTLADTCLSCRYYSLCHGGCPAQRVGGVNALCAGYTMFFEHVRPAMDRMRALLEAGRAPAEVMETYW